MGLKYIVHRKDRNQDAIVDGLRDCGVEVYYWGGKGNADVVTLYRGNYLPLEIKAEGGKLRASQEDKPWPVVYCFREAWDHIKRAAR